MAYVCLSFTHASRDLAEQARRQIESNGIRVWWREPSLDHTNPLESKTLDAAFRGASAVAFIYSEDETLPDFFRQDYNAVKAIGAPVYLVTTEDKVAQLIVALRKLIPATPDLAPLPVMAREEDLIDPDGDRLRTRDLPIIRIAAVALVLVNLIAFGVLLIFSSGGGSTAEVTAEADSGGAPPTAAIAITITAALTSEITVTPLMTVNPALLTLPALVLETPTTTPSLTYTATATATTTPSATATLTATATATPSATLTPSTTPTLQPTVTASATATMTPTATLTPRPTRSAPPTATMTVTTTATPSTTASATATGPLAMPMTNTPITMPTLTPIPFLPTDAATTPAIMPPFMTNTPDIKPGA